MQSTLLDKQVHDRTSFNCGVSALNDYLMSMANQQAKKDNARTYVITSSEKEGRIIGFYTLTMATIVFTGLPATLQKKHHNASSAGLIARLAVDNEHKGKGLGEWLLIDALKRLLLASEEVGFPIVMVDAKDGAEEFYTTYGFTPFSDAPNKLFMTVADIRATSSSK